MKLWFQCVTKQLPLMRWSQTQIVTNEHLKKKIINFNLKCAEEYSFYNHNGVQKKPKCSHVAQCKKNTT